MVSAHDVARELTRRLPSAGDVKVQKLLYYCQGWYLAWTGKLMFREAIQAWENGPVVADLWHAKDKGLPVPAALSLDHEMLLVVDYVVSRYGRLSGRDLIELTHAEEPWREAYQGGGMNAEITAQVMASYFSTDDELLDVQETAARAAAQTGLQRAVEAASRPRDGVIRDDTDSLRELLKNLG